MPACLIRPVAASRGKFADQYTTCGGCQQPPLDVDGIGVHPDPECEHLAPAP